MKTAFSHPRRRSGIMLTECMMYIAVLAVLMALGFQAFYKCWDNSDSLGYASDDVVQAMRAGERWRDDVRNATGKITVTTGTNGDTFHIPSGKTAIVYSLNSGELRRKTAAGDALVFAQIKTSQMKLSPRVQTSACLWELELTPHRPRSRTPLLFTFIAVPPQTP